MGFTIDERSSLFCSQKKGFVTWTPVSPPETAAACSPCLPFAELGSGPGKVQNN